MDLLSDHEEEPLELKVNQEYATKFAEKKRQEDLKKAKDMDLSSDSDYSTEDEDAELLTDHVQNKVLDTLVKIRTKDPSIYEKEKQFWEDDDFGNKPKPIATEIKKPTPAEEEAAFRKDFLNAADEVESDDDFFTMKKKTVEEEEQEEKEYDSFVKTRMRSNKEMDILSRYYDADKKLDEDEFFLKDYLLNKRWVDNNPLQQKMSDDEEEDLDKLDEFEHKYNFRFEQEGGTNIQSHARNVVGSVRQKDDKRKKARARAKEAKEEEKVKRMEELKRLKNIKKQEIANRLKAIKDMTGNSELAFDKVDLEADWDPEQHDKEMQAMIGEDYDEKDEALDPAELLKKPEGEVFADTIDGYDDAVAPEAEPAEEEWGEEWGEQEWAGDAEATGAEEGGWDENGEEHPDWYLCDGCYKGIVGGHKRFDCTQCKDFTLCTKCFRTVGHKHRMQKKSTPAWCMPPEEYKGKHFIPDREQDKEEKKDLDQYMDEYFKMDYEDIIGGDLPTRFKYATVPARKYGMTPEFVMQKTDSELQEILPLKAIAPFREEGEAYEDRHGNKWRYGKKVEDANWWKGKSHKKKRNQDTPEDKPHKKKRKVEAGGEEAKAPEEAVLDAINEARKQKAKKKKSKGPACPVDDDRLKAYGMNKDQWKKSKKSAW